MKAEDGVIVLVAFIGLCVSVGLVFEAGYKCCRDSFKNEAVEHGAAHYDETTGEWQWNNPRKAD